MGGVPVKHHTKSKVGRRRSHLAKKPIKLSPCTQCKAPILAHRICKQCGYYPSNSHRSPRSGASSEAGKSQ